MARRHGPSFTGGTSSARDDGTILAFQRWARDWERLEPETFAQFRSRLQLTLPAFKTAIQQAHQLRLTQNGGRIGAATSLPDLVTDARNLDDFYEDTGFTDATPPPPPCGKAVPDQADNPGLMRDCETLLGFKDALRGTGALNWSVDVAMADWDGVRTRETGRVTDINLAGKSLTGTVPAQLADLTGLRYLVLSNNELTGEVPPELATLSALESLLLSDNQLTGAIPPELGSMTGLRTVWLHRNDLSGTIPDLSGMTGLQKLLLSSNALTGSIPAGLGSIAGLNTVWLNHNQLTGAIPAELGNLDSLERLHLSYNQLTGQLPAELANLADTLTELKLSHNQFTGCIPVGLKDVGTTETNDLSWFDLPDCTG